MTPLGEALLCLLTDTNNFKLLEQGGNVRKNLLIISGVSNVSPSESYWSQLDAQGVRNAVNMVNGMSVNGLGEVSMDTTQTLLNNNLMASNNLIALVDSQHMGGKS